MAKRKTSKKNRVPPKWFLPEWRTFRDKMSGEKLAELAGFGSKSYVSEFETGERRYNEDALKAFAKALECEPEDILNINPLIWYAEKLPENAEFIRDRIKRVPVGERDDFIDTTVAMLERLKSKPKKPPTKSKPRKKQA